MRVSKRLDGDKSDPYMEISNALKGEKSDLGTEVSVQLNGDKWKVKGVSPTFICGQVQG
jgi:hypothetical protein